MSDSFEILVKNATRKQPIATAATITVGKQDATADDVAEIVADLVDRSTRQTSRRANAELEHDVLGSILAENDSWWLVLFDQTDNAQALFDEPLALIVRVAQEAHEQGETLTASNLTDRLLAEDEARWIRPDVYTFLATLQSGSKIRTKAELRRAIYTLRGLDIPEQHSARHDSEVGAGDLDDVIWKFLVHGGTGLAGTTEDTAALAQHLIETFNITRKEN